MGDYNKDELNAPEWMDNTFFENVLKSSENSDSIAITELKITPATIKGDHFASVMFRATITYDTSDSKGNTKSVIIKTMPETVGLKKDMLEDSFVFETEIRMYSETIPKFESELRKIGDNTELGAKALYYSLEPRKCIIFEDIVPKGYVTIRDRFANATEVKAAFIKLAKWHAVSYKLAADGDTSVTSYRDGFLNMKDVETMPFMATGMQSFIEKVEQIDELKMYLPKLRSIQTDILKRCLSSGNTYRQEAAEGIFVLCHGDFHARNMMFKTDQKGEFEDVMLLDFQLCYFGPAVMDLMYAMYTLLSKDLRLNHREELVYYYATNFVHTLKKLKYKGECPKIATFMIELIKHRHWELFLLSSLLPMVYATTSKIEEEIEDILSSNDVRKKLYDNPEYVEEVKQLLPIMLHRGYLE